MTPVSSSAKENRNNVKPERTTTAKKKSVKNKIRSKKKEPLPGQLRIDSFFVSKKCDLNTKTESENIRFTGKNLRRKLIFSETFSTTLHVKSEVVDLCDTDNDEEIVPLSSKEIGDVNKSREINQDKPLILNKKENATTACHGTGLDCNDMLVSEINEHNGINILKVLPNGKLATGASNIPKLKRERKKRSCPPYKIVEGTNFAVDAFSYGNIEGVTYYFLTHFHADHYVGLTRKFANKICMSSITARLIRAFIPVDEELITVLELNQPTQIDGTEVTAINANHCPGAIMLVFKLPNGRCILHTGDFRACAEMESEPIFWNNDIHTIYLDTTYLNDKYDFCSQHESIDIAIKTIEEFREKNVGTRVLYVCGSYLIGKEKFWSAIAQRFSFKVWTEAHRRKALETINDEELNSLLATDPYNALMHVVPMTHLSYEKLLQYYEPYSDRFDMIFALRPSGWERNKPQYRKKICITGVQYSEHSSYSELRRFISFLKPKEVLSTVPVARDPFITPKIPYAWYKYETLQPQKQSSIMNYFNTNEKCTRTTRSNAKQRKLEHKSASVSIEGVIKC